MSSIDVQLRKRHDLIPNVVKLAEKFMAHEKGLLSSLTELRTQAMRELRFLFAREPKIMGEVLSLVNRTLSTFLIKKAGLTRNQVQRQVL